MMCRNIICNYTPFMGNYFCNYIFITFHPLMFVLCAKIALNIVISMILYIFSLIMNGVMTTPKLWVLPFLFTVLCFKKSLLISWVLAMNINNDRCLSNYNLLASCKNDNCKTAAFYFVFIFVRLFGTFISHFP